MIRRVAMWRLKRETDAERMKIALDSMAARVPALESMETGINISESASAFDIVFIATFSDLDQLKAFEADAYHGEVGELVKTLRDERVVVDYEF